MRCSALRLLVRTAALTLTLGTAYALPASGGAQAMALPEPVGMAGDPGARLVRDGNAAFLAGDLATAASDYRGALKLHPELAVARFNLGLVEVHGSARTAGIRDMDRGIVLATAHHMSRAFVARLRALRAAFVQAPTADA